MDEDHPNDGSKLFGDFTWAVSKLALQEPDENDEDPPPLLSLTEVTNNILGENSPNKYDLKEIENIYFKVMRELLSFYTIENASNKSLKKDSLFFALCEEIGNDQGKEFDDTPNLELWKKINADFGFFLKHHREQIRRLVGPWKIHLKMLHFYHSSLSRETELLFRVQQWLVSPHLSRDSYLKWLSIYKEKKPTLDLRGSFEGYSPLRNDRRLFENFKLALNETDPILSDNISQKLYKYLDDLFCLKQSDIGKTRLILTQKVMLLSKTDIAGLIAKERSKGTFVTEIVLFAQNTLIVDCPLHKEYMHGKNLSIVCGTIVIYYENTVFDVSGMCGCALIGHRDVDKSQKEQIYEAMSNGCLNKCRERRGNTETVPDCVKGIDGANGRAGESSGNVTIVAEMIRNGHCLTINLNGGNGEGGQNGGTGGCGTEGKGTTSQELDELLCLKYNTMYFANRKTFQDHKPGHGFEINSKLCRSSSESEPFYFVNHFENKTDGRSIEFSLVEHKQNALTKYDLYFLVRGGPGKAPGVGGRHGLGGGGGRCGEFVSICKRTELALDGIIVKQDAGQDGDDGIRGPSGLPGRNGNDLVMIDRSNVMNAKDYIGKGEKKLVSNYCRDYESDTRLNGFLKYRIAAKLCFVRFIEEDLDTIPVALEEVSTQFDEKMNSQCKQTIVLENLMNDFERNKTNEMSLSLVVRPASHTEIEEATAEEAITILKNRIERSMKKTVDGNSVDKAEVIRRILNLSGNETTEQLAEIWKEVFKVFIDDHRVIETMDNMFHEMDPEQRQEVEADWRDKKQMLMLPPPRDNYEEHDDFHSTDEYLLDVCEVPLTEDWINWSSEEHQNLVQKPFMEKMEKYYCHSNDVLSALVGIRATLRDEELVKALEDKVNWNDKEAVIAYFAQATDEDMENQGRRRPRRNPLEEAERVIRDNLDHPVYQHQNELISLLKGNIELEELFALQRDSSEEIPEIGGDIRSLIFIYFHSKELIKLNEDVRRYYKAETTVLIPGMLFENVEMSKDYLEKILKKGINSTGYLHFLADTEEINIEVYVRCSGSSMLRITNINEELSPTYRLFFDEEGSPWSIGAHHNSRRLKSLLNSCLGPQVTLSNSDSLIGFVPKSERGLMEFWTNTVGIALNSSDITRLLRRSMELSGAYLTSVETIFILNSCMDLVCNHDAPMAHMENIVAATAFKNLPNWMLKLRILAKTSKWQWDPTLLNRVSRGDMAALFGSHLHDIDWTNFKDKASILVKFLSDSAVSFHQLEHSSFETILNLAAEHTTTDYADLERRYGHLAYYIILLRLKEDEKSLIEIFVAQLMYKRIPILPKTLALLTYLKCSNEDTFGLNEELREILQLCPEPSLESSHKVTELDQQRRIAELRQGDCWRAVFPSENRTLEEIGQLSVNHDFAEEEMSEIIRMLKANDGTQRCVEKLREIDDAIEKFKGFRLRDTQKIAILCGYLHKRNLVSQVVTGEGKTLIIAALSILYITLEGANVDIITSSSVLAMRDAVDYKEFYDHFGIKASHNCEENIERRKYSYAADIVYGDVAHFERDFLLHHYYQKNVLGKRQRNSTIVIVDEVDSMLLDHGSNMLYLSHNVTGLEALEPLYVYIHMLIRSAAEGETVISLKTKIRKAVLMDLFGMVSIEDIKNLEVTPETATLAWDQLRGQDVVDSEGVLNLPSNIELGRLGRDLIRVCGSACAQRILALLTVIKERRRTINIPKYLEEFAKNHLNDFVDSAIKAIFMKQNDEYVIDVDQSQRSGDGHPVVTIIDKGTGTDLRSSQWTNGLHQFLQIANGCRVTPLSLKAVFISNVTFLKGYKKINGLSGTLGSDEERKCLKELYGADVMRIPTCKPRMFAIDVPIVTIKEEEWLKSIYDSVKDKLLAERSVLIICSTINEVDQLKDELPRLCNRFDKENQQLKDAFKEATLYRRDIEQFEIGKQGLECGRLIISTNLAGRGTDIKLCKDLQDNGGLHVIIGLCENQRIEDQAFGRAARCGDYGSGQIIALTDDETAVNIFALQKHRNLAEQQRLRSLKKYYDYHINVEEECLNLFMKHCRELLQVVHNEYDYSSTAAIKYFALLDIWALELDRMSVLIKYCEDGEDEETKQNIIREVSEFLEKHRLDLGGDEPPGWITLPQPLLHFAMAMTEQENHDSAMSLLHQIAIKFPDFVGEAFYYLGAFMQQNVKQLRQFRRAEDGHGWLGKIQDKGEDIQFYVLRQMQNVFGEELSFLTEVDEGSRNEAVRYLLLARAEFTRRLERESQLCATVVQLQGGSAGGYRAQKQETIAVWEAFIDTIDRILGKHASDKGLKEDKDSDEMALIRRKILTHAGILTPPVLQDVISRDHLMRIAHKHSLPLAELKNLIHSLQNDNSLPEYEGRRIVDVQSIARLPIPNATEFWECLQKKGVFCFERRYFAVKKSIQKFSSDWQKCSIVFGPMDIALRNCDPELFDFYELSNLTVIQQDPDLNSKLYMMMSSGLAHIEIIGTVNPLVALEDIILDKYDFMTSSTLKKELSLATGDAEWILQKLVKNGVLEQSIVEGEACFIRKGRLDFSMFPEGMQESLWTVFTRNFSYGYAFNSLRASVRGLTKGEKLSYLILLPSYPHSELLDDMIASGVLVQSRVSSTLLKYEEKRYLFSSVKFLPSWLYEKLEPLSPTLIDSKCTLEKTHEYMKNQGVPACSALRNAISNGLVKSVNATRKSNNSRIPAVFFKAISCLLTTKLRFIGKFAKSFSAIEAKIGTNQYFMELTKENQKGFALSNCSFEEEFKELRQCHQDAVDSMSAYAKHSDKVKNAQRLINARIKEIHQFILRHCVVTHCKAEVSTEIITKCVAECGLLPMLEESITSFMMFTVRQSVINVLQAIDTSSKLNPIDLKPLSSVVSFARAAVVDAVKSMISSNTEQEIKIRITPDVVNMDTVKGGVHADNIAKILKSTDTTLQSVLAKELHSLLNRIFDRVLLGQVRPMARKMMESWEEEGAPSLNTNNEYNEQRMEEGCEEEQLNIQGKHPFLFRDLYNIFLKITFKEQNERVIAHMVKYNFPLGTHCTALVAKGVLLLLNKSNIPFNFLEIMLARGAETVYRIGFKGQKGGNKCFSLKLKLENSCFFAGSDIINKHAQVENSLFAEMQNKIPEMAKEFPDETAFLERLSMLISEPVGVTLEQWGDDDHWKGAEKL